MPPNILFPNARPQDFITEPILECEYLDPGYSGHAADVWRVRTEKRAAALRIFNASAWNGPFWDGMRWLFHWLGDFRRKAAGRNRFLREAGGLPVPGVLAHGARNGLDYMLMEWMPGLRMETFAELGPEGLRGFGRHLAALHARTFPSSGTLHGAKGRPAAQFHVQLVETLNMLFESYYRDQPDFARRHQAMLRQARQARSERCSPVLVDLGAGQYLRSERGELCALVDTDAYAIGPRELDFILLEYGLSPALAKDFAKGYQEALPLPRLREVRPVYRYLYRMMEVEGAVPLREWMEQEAIFP
jgi:aminoglycoside phosphotransferase (APT) family kinase protein